MDKKDEIVNVTLKQQQLKSIKFEIPVELHSEIKQRASALNMTIKKWMLQAAVVKMQTEDKYRD